jgi:ribosomal protein S26
MASPRDPNRIRRVRHLKSTAPGWISVVICRKCSHMAALPYDRLLKRFGELFPADDALIWVRCSECGAQSPEARQMKLCEPGCSRQRG